MSGFNENFEIDFYLFHSGVNDGREIDGNGTVTNLQSVIDHQIETQDETVAKPDVQRWNLHAGTQPCL